MPNLIEPDNELPEHFENWFDCWLYLKDEIEKYPTYTRVVLGNPKHVLDTNHIEKMALKELYSQLPTIRDIKNLLAVSRGDENLYRFINNLPYR